jgi:hypothetical protein
VGEDTFLGHVAGVLAEDGKDDELARGRRRWAVSQDITVGAALGEVDGWQPFTAFVMHVRGRRPPGRHGALVWRRSTGGAVCGGWWVDANSPRR